MEAGAVWSRKACEEALQSKLLDACYRNFWITLGRFKCSRRICSRAGEAAFKEYAAGTLPQL